MKNKIKMLIITLGVLVCITSCKKEVSDLKDKNLYREKLKTMGFVKNVVEKDEYFIIDGDIRILKSDLDKQKKLVVPKLAQAYAGITVSTSTITVNVDSSIPTGGDDDWHTEIANALSYWNSITNFGLNFQLTSSSNADIIISADNGILGNAVNAAGVFPINSLAGNSIIINLDAESNATIPSTKKELIIAHEIGHNIGFRHTDYQNDSYGSPTAYVIEGTRPSTPSLNNPDPLSVMNNGFTQASLTWRGFSDLDIIAIRNLYPLDSYQKPFYRYFNSAVTRHHYTANWAELGTGASGFNYEGIAGFIYIYNISGTIPWYRYYRAASNNHYFSTSSSAPSGYISEGIAGYVFSSNVPGSIPLYQYYSSSKGHLYTTDYSELGSGSSGYTYEVINCYVMQ
jgi:hypothetical protein